MTDKTYSSKSNAKRAARKALGAEAIEGLDYILSGEGKSWTWTSDPAAAAAMEAEGTFDDTEAEPDPAAVEAAEEKAQDALLDEFWSGAETDFDALDAAAGEPEPEPTKAAKKPRGYAAEVKAAVAAGDYPWPPAASAKNLSYIKRYEKIGQMLDNEDLDGLTALVVGGTNTYSKMERAYRDACIAYLSQGDHKQAAE